MALDYWLPSDLGSGKAADHSGRLGVSCSTAWETYNSGSGRRPLAGADIGQERLQRRAVERGAGECAIVVVARNQPPRYFCALAPPELPPRMRP